MAFRPELPKQPDRIETERLVLRRFAAADALAVARHMASRDMSWNLGRVPHPYSLDDARAFVERDADPHVENHAITLRDGTLIGSCGMFWRPPSPERPNEMPVVALGYWIGPDHWGRGFAPEAVAAKLFEHFARGGATVHARAFQDNPRSLAVLRHAGFRMAGEDADTNMVREGEHPVWLTECTAEDFRDAPWNRAVPRENAA